MTRNKPQSVIEQLVSPHAWETTVENKDDIQPLTIVGRVKSIEGVPDSFVQSVNFISLMISTLATKVNGSQVDVFIKYHTENLIEGCVYATIKAVNPGTGLYMGVYFNSSTVLEKNQTIAYTIEMGKFRSKHEMKPSLKIGASQKFTTNKPILSEPIINTEVGEKTIIEHISIATSILSLEPSFSTHMWVSRPQMPYHTSYCVISNKNHVEVYRNFTINVTGHEKPEEQDNLRATLQAYVDDMISEAQLIVGDWLKLHEDAPSSLLFERLPLISNGDYLSESIMIIGE